MTAQPKDPAILSDPIAQAWRRGELDGGEVLTPQPMTDTPDTLVTVEQCDRDAAADLLARSAHDIEEWEAVTAVRAGERDPSAAVQAFARQRHRLTAQSERVVEVLREARQHTATLAMYDGSAPLEDRFVSIPAVAARRAKRTLAKIDALLSSLDGKGF